MVISGPILRRTVGVRLLRPWFPSAGGQQCRRSNVTTYQSIWYKCGVCASLPWGRYVTDKVIDDACGDVRDHWTKPSYANLQHELYARQWYITNYPDCTRPLSREVTNRTLSSGELRLLLCAFDSSQPPCILPWDSRSCSCGAKLTIYSLCPLCRCKDSQRRCCSWSWWSWRSTYCWNMWWLCGFLGPWAFRMASGIWKYCNQESSP